MIECRPFSMIRGVNGMTNKLLSQARTLTESNTEAPEFAVLPQSLMLEEVHFKYILELWSYST